MMPPTVVADGRLPAPVHEDQGPAEDADAAAAAAAHLPLSAERARVARRATGRRLSAVRGQHPREAALAQRLPLVSRCCLGNSGLETFS